MLKPLEGSAYWNLWSLRHHAIVYLSTLCSALSLVAYPADVTFRWDYSHSGAAGFAFYCGAEPRHYVTRIDVGNTDTFTLSVPEGAQFCSVRAYDTAGWESTFSDEVGVSVDDNTGASAVPPILRVNEEEGGVIPTPSGFHIVFSVPIDGSWLDLSGSAADLTLFGERSGLVRGSVVLDEDNRGFTFVKTAGLLSAETYTLTIASRPDSLVDRFGRVLYGDGVSGGDYNLFFEIAPSESPILAIGEFARGPGQTVNLPAADTVAGIPVRISNGATVHGLAFTLRYNPRLLSVHGVSLAKAVTGNLTVASIGDPGLVQVRVANLSGLTNASTVVLRLQAQVPADAPYGHQHVLDISDMEFNAGTLAGRDDDGLHLVAKPGDTSGESEYSSSDATLIQRVIVRLDSAFSAYPLTDPVVLGDVNDNVRLDAADALLVQYKALGRVVPQIPD